MAITFTTNREWIAQVTYISLTLPDDNVWTDPTCYLFVKMDSVVTSPVIFQGKIQSGGATLPVRLQGGNAKIDAYFRGKCSGNSDIMSFSLLDHNLQPVETARLVVTMHLFTDPGYILTK